MGVGKHCWLAPSITLFAAQGHLQGRPSLTFQSYPLCPQLASTSSWIIFFITLNLIWNGVCLFVFFIWVLDIYCCITNYMNTKWLQIKHCFSGLALLEQVGQFWLKVSLTRLQSSCELGPQSSEGLSGIGWEGHFSGGFLTRLSDGGLRSLPLPRAA